ncbi:MAG: hypothetical protein WEA61_02385 [Anaerolineales bacterium]
MDFGRVLTRSWEIIWKHKALWIFGILASCGGQFGGLSGSGTNYSFDVSDTRNLPGQFDRFFADWERSINQFVNNVGPSFFVALACVAVILAIFFWVVGIYGKVGLISGVLKAEARRAVGFRVVAAEAWPVLGSALGLNFILALLPIAAVILLIILAIPVGILTLGIGLLCLIPLVCLLIPIGIAYGVYIEMANISLVRDRQGVGLALSRAWQVFRDHLGPLAGMAIILILGGLVVGAILAAPFLAIFAPAFIALIGPDPQAVGPALTTTFILLLIAIPIYLLIGGIITSYVQSAWTLTYVQLAPAASKSRPRTARK